MARFLGIDWDYDRMYLASLRVQGGKVQVEKAIVWEQQHNLSPGAVEELGARLRDELKAAKIAPAPVLACVGRERVILKEVKFPKVDDESQEPALVRFQVNKDLTEPPDRVIIDYVRQKNSRRGENRATVSIVRKEWLRSLENICQAAGLKVQAYVPRPFGIAGCITHADKGLVSAVPSSSTATVGVITVTQDWAELTVVRDQDVVLSRALTGNGDSLVSELRRTLMLFSTKNGSDPIELIYLVGAGDNADLRDQLGEQLNCPVEALDPFGFAGAGAHRGAADIQSSDAIAKKSNQQIPTEGLPEERGGFASLVGLAYLQSEKRPLPINLAAPKKPKVEGGTKRESIVVIGGILFLVLFLGGFAAHFFLSSKDATIADLRKEIKAMDDSIEAAGPDRKKVAAVIEWDSAALPWADELYNLTAYFPYKVNFRVTRVRVDANQTRTKNEFPMMAQLELLAPDISHVQEFIDRINKDDYYTAEKGKEEPGTDPRTGDRVRKVVIRVFMKKRPWEEQRIQAFVPKWKREKK